MPTKSRITLFQIFFLSFAYVFSGVFLIRERAFLSLLIPLALALAYCALGYSFLLCAPQGVPEHGRWLSFLSCGKPYILSRVLAAALTLLCAAELIVSWIAFSVSVRSFSNFISFSLAAAVILFLAVFFGAHGLTALGRFAELFPFLIVPLFLRLLLLDLNAVDFGAFSENYYAFFTVTPGPFLYLFAMTALRSTAMPNGVKNPIAVPVSAWLGCLAAVFCAFLFLLYGAGDGNIFRLLFGWMASLVRLALLICLCTAHREEVRF